MRNTSYEHISNENAHSEGRTDANLANDSNHLGGIPAEEYATQEYVRSYHDTKEAALKQYVDEQDANTLNSAKEYTNSAIRNQDFSHFAKDTDLVALKNNLEATIDECADECNARINSVVSDVNDNFDTVNSAIDNLEDGQEELFTSVSNGKRAVAEAITDKGVPTSATATFSTMANNIRNINTGGGGTDTSDATATSEQILEGYTAYARGQKLYGSLQVERDSTTGEIIVINTGSGVQEIYGLDEEDYALGRYYNATATKIYTGVDANGNLIDSGITANYAGVFCADGKMLLRYMTATVDGVTKRYIFINEIDENNLIRIHVTTNPSTRNINYG